MFDPFRSVVSLVAVGTRSKEERGKRRVAGVKKEESDVEKSVDRERGEGVEGDVAEDRRESLIGVDDGATRTRRQNGATECDAYGLRATRRT